MPLLCGLVVVMCSAYYLPHMCPWSFTFGELSIVTHILGSAAFRMASWMDRFSFDEVSSVICQSVLTCEACYNGSASFFPSVRLVAIIRFQSLKV